MRVKTIQVSIKKPFKNRSKFTKVGFFLVLPAVTLYNFEWNAY